MLDTQGVDFWGELKHGGTFKIDVVSSEGGVRAEHEKYEGEDILVFAPRAYRTREEDAARLLEELNDFFGAPSP